MKFSPKKTNKDSAVYKLPDLVNKFSDHAKEFEKSRGDQKKTFLEEYPNEPLPEYFKDDFNLPLAMATICAELLRLKIQQELKD